MLDIALLKLQYEILNKTAKELADDCGLPEDAIQDAVDEGKWKQWWPASIDAEIVAKNALKVEDKDELLVLQSEQFLDRAKRRLAVYTLAKEIYLAQKYMKLESAIVDKAYSIVENIGESDTKAVKELSALYKDMTAKSPISALAALSFCEDEGGMPQVIIRDLSGTK